MDTTLAPRSSAPAAAVGEVAAEHGLALGLGQELAAGLRGLVEQRRVDGHVAEHDPRVAEPHRVSSCTGCASRRRRRAPDTDPGTAPMPRPGRPDRARYGPSTPTASTIGVTSMPPTLHQLTFGGAGSPWASSQPITGFRSTPIRS